MTKLLFVCTGNICRSPTAEAVFRHKVIEQGLEDQFHIDSAGTHGYHVGEPPDHRSIMMAEQHGVSMQGITGRKAAVSDFKNFDLILALDYGHYTHLDQMKPAQGGAKLALYLDYHPEYQGQNVPDPYYGDHSGFKHVFDLIDKTSDFLLKDLLK